MNQAGGTNDDEPRISVSALFNNMSDDKLNEYKTLFDTLELNNVHTIDEADITTAISINGLTLTNEEVSSCMKALSSQVENNTYTFDEERCEKAMKILKSKLKNQSEDLTNNILYSYDNNNASFEEHHEV